MSGTFWWLELSQRPKFATLCELNWSSELISEAVHELKVSEQLLSFLATGIVQVNELVDNVLVGTFAITAFEDRPLSGIVQFLFSETMYLPWLSGQMRFRGLCYFLTLQPLVERQLIWSVHYCTITLYRCLDNTIGKFPAYALIIKRRYCLLFRIRSIR